MTRLICDALIYMFWNFQSVSTEFFSDIIERARRSKVDVHRMYGSDRYWKHLEPDKMHLYPNRCSLTIAINLPSRAGWPRTAFERYGAWYDGAARRTTSMQRDESRGNIFCTGWNLVFHIPQINTITFCPLAPGSLDIHFHQNEIHERDAIRK